VKRLSVAKLEDEIFAVEERGPRPGGLSTGALTDQSLSGYQGSRSTKNARAGGVGAAVTI
jgi:hypothetical protein